MYYGTAAARMGNARRAPGAEKAICSAGTYCGYLSKMS